MRTIPLGGASGRGLMAMVDDEDYELVSQYKWNALWTRELGRTRTSPYAGTLLRRDGQRVRSRVLMHVLIMGHRGVDHVNHNGLDNRRSNLRPATNSQNAANRRPYAGRSSRFKGVSWDKQKSRWFVLITVNGRRRYLGRFRDEEAAARAYDAAARELFGGFACLNFPPQGTAVLPPATSQTSPTFAGQRKPGLG